MPSLDVDRLKEQGRRLLDGFTTGQKVVTCFAFVAVLAGGYLFTQASSQPTQSALFSNLDPADASAITQQLKDQGVDYQLEDGGRTVTVPQDQVYQLRLDMSAAGLPGGGGGYALLDQEGITTSEFRQRIDYQRALQGELGKTIQAMDGVEAASVHLVVPRQDVFADDTQKSSASVLVRTAPDRPLNESQTQAMVHLVAASVDGLDPQAITVADTSGRVLWAPGPDGGVGATDSGSGSSSYETGLSHELQQMLDRVLGPGRSVVAVQATLDPNRRTTTSETYTNPATDPAAPTPVLPLEQSLNTETLQGSGSSATGVLGPDGLPLASTGQPSNYNKSESTTKNAVDKVVEQTQTPPGAVTTQSVSVMLDAAHVPAARLPALQQSITTAAGIQFQRGDLVTVTRVPFDDALAKQAKAELASSEQSGKSDSMFSMIKIVVALIVVFAVLILLWRAMKRAAENRPPARVPLDVSRLEMLDALSLSAPTGLELPVGVSPEPQVQTEVGRLIDHDPEDVALTLRSWLSERGR